jgi:ATP-dependent RNA helicase DHX57
MLAEIKQQLLELLASIGFIPVEIAPRQPGHDNILNITGPEVSKNSQYFKRSVTFLTLFSLHTCFL